MRLKRSPLLLAFILAATSVTSTLHAQTKPRFESKVIAGATTPGQSIPIEADITGAKSLFLVVQDGGDSFGCDWADWVEPKLIGPKGDLKLTELKWKSAAAGFGKVALNANCAGDPIKVAGKSVEFGIGTHANSLIEYELPAGSNFTKFTARGALDDAGVKQGCGSTVQFFVFTDKPDTKYLVAAVGAPAGVGSRDPLDAVKSLDIAEGLEATLFASEASNPPMLNPTSIDIDHLGRIWVCEVVNYRHRNGERKEGDRILILEDTNGDGIADKQTVFHQGRDVDTAHGICVLPTPSGKGTKIIISCGDSVFFLHDDNGDLKSDRKEILFTGISGTQHDHGIHAFHFGPDGKLYFNFGNSGKQIKDKDGKPIIDLAGNEVNDAKSHYQEGMVFRCNMDGSQFETLGWNFRNNWEIAVDSFGTLWQSDNDDDGNKGVRINYVMEFGNYGYKDEFTRAGWQTPRTNLEQEIPLRHWHLNDPGVVPNLLQTGAGSPTGIVVYEGDLLPEVFRNQVIHCDAGPNVVRAYPAKKSGAGYTAESVNILFGARDNWFRPSDVCVAPDGSLIVADWYDPGVGGHRMGDADKGRLFRVAPPKSPYKFPKVDVSTVEGAIAALKSPNEATRYLAWTSLHAMGDKARNRLEQEFKSGTSPRQRARVLGVLASLSDPLRSVSFLQNALSENDEDIRITALRLLRQANVPGQIPVAVNRLIQDPSPAVRRECLIALRNSIRSGESPVHFGLWANLANMYDRNDRWYLEAIGISAANDWNDCLDAFVKYHPTTLNTEIGRDIVWRSRSKQTPGLLVKILTDTSVTADAAPRYLRAFDFLTGQEKEDALIQLAFGNFGDEAKTKFINSEALNRLKGFDVSQNEQQKAALNRVLEGLKDQPQFITLVDKFSVSDRYVDLLNVAIAKPDDQIGVDAIRVLLKKQQTVLMTSTLTGWSKLLNSTGPAEQAKRAARAALATATALSNSGDGAASPLLLPIVKDEKAPDDIRRQAIKGAARTKAGAVEMLKLAEAKAFDDTFAPALSAALQSAPLDETQRGLVAKLFPSPEGKDAKPLPSLGELAMLKGNSGNGAKIYATTGKCANCHIVNNQGKEVGPNLSEIGSKLSRQAMFESIIFPSAGISHNYETFSAVMKDGTIFNGILISETADAVTLRNNEAITKTVARQDIDELVKQKLSLMPADLAKLLSIQELTDVIEYLATLKKK